ncbi:unnamed protein product [Moneuplotes crassus]|uniref:Uncharacterized protein n=1 Tax=Euplotes crassus TaxID=5936 RepID=A0AAD1UEM2_EUPCR|nr:unnamed protein product [Moneuplotes crassus]
MATRYRVKTSPAKQRREADQLDKYFRENPHLAPFKRESAASHEDMRFYPLRELKSRNRKRKNKETSKCRFDSQNESSTSHNISIRDWRLSIPTFRFNSRPEESTSNDELPGPGGYFQNDLRSSLGGPKYSFTRLKRDFGSIFGNSTNFNKRKISLQDSIVDLDKYKIEEFIDTSHIKEREFTKKIEDSRDFMTLKYEPTTPSYSFKRINPLLEITKKIKEDKNMIRNKPKKVNRLSTKCYRDSDFEQNNKLFIKIRNIGQLCEKKDIFTNFIGMAPEIEVSEEAALPKYKMKNRAQSNYSNRIDQLDLSEKESKMNYKLKDWNSHVKEIRTRQIKKKVNQSLKNSNHIMNNIRRASTGKGGQKEKKTKHSFNMNSKNSKVRKKLSITIQPSSYIHDEKLQTVKAKADRLFKQKRQFKKSILKKKFFRIGYCTDIGIKCQANKISTYWERANVLFAFLHTIESQYKQKKHDLNNI